MKKVRGYIYSRPFMGERVPQHVQNIVIRDYCERNGLHFLLSAAEYAMADSDLILEQVLCELKDIDGIIAYSLFQLPEDSIKRHRIYNQIIDMKKNMYFAVEGLSMTTIQDCERIETLWCVRQTLPNCCKCV
jgi:sporadic carbohydrate cluster protein (TIGR04323 family)